MKYRKLLIAWSVGWGVVAMLVVAFWIKSYSGRTTRPILVTPTDRYYVHSLAGTVAVERERRVFITVEIQRIYEEADYLPLTTNAGIKVFDDDSELYAVSVSYWLLAVIALFGIAFPWVRWRFSLRTLLIAATVVAIGLGLAVMMVRGE